MGKQKTEKEQIIKRVFFLAKQQIELEELIN